MIKISPFIDSFYTENEEWFFDEDQMVGIQLLKYPDTVPDVTIEELNKIKNYTHIIYQSDFKKHGAPTGSAMINNKDGMIELINGRANLKHQALLRRLTISENPSIEDDFDCMFLQANPKDNDSKYCQDEKTKWNRINCEYWQTCEFKVEKGRDCEVMASKVVALVIPVVILLLTTAIFAIYCFKKKADKAEEQNEEINKRLPDFGAQSSTRPNQERKEKSILQRVRQSFSKKNLNKATYKTNDTINDTPHGVTPGEF